MNEGVQFIQAGNSKLREGFLSRPCHLMKHPL